MNTATGFVYHEDYLKHDTGRNHPESANRLISILQKLEEQGLMSGRIERLQPVNASREDIVRVHTDAYVRRVEAICDRGGGMLDPDTPLCSDSYNIALLAAGGVLKAVDGVMDESNNLKHVFALVRPPGHHATSSKGMGFCIFNNLAIATEHLKRNYGIKRILIVDWDVHHGNGTQDLFFEDRSVLYFSTHQYPHYPHTGGIDEVGEGEGEGFTVNLPLPAGTDDVGYLYALNNILMPIAAEFGPEFLLVSAGFDAHTADPLASMHVTSSGFGLFMDLIAAIAEENCGGRIAMALEGGYNLDAIAESALSVFNSLLSSSHSRSHSRSRSRSREPKEGEFSTSKQVAGRVEEVKKVQKEYWGI